MSDRLDQDADSPPAAGGPDERRREREFDGDASQRDPTEELLERGPLEPGSPSLENAIFVLLGASGMVLLLLTALL